MKYNNVKIWLSVAVCTLFMSTTMLQAQSIRIMPLGDSITAGVGPQFSNFFPNPLTLSGYRAPLWEKLKDAEYDVDFVGSKSEGSAVSPAFDTDHSGYINYKSEQIAAMTYDLMLAHHPDIVLLHIGTNDVSPFQCQNDTSATGLESILDAIESYENNTKRSVHVILATIIPIQFFKQNLVSEYNHNLRVLATARMAQGDKLTLVEMQEEADLQFYDYADFLHPNYFGYEKMSQVWFDQLEKILSPSE